MKKPQNIQAIYIFLVLGNTLAASFIWGINTIFLLDAGLSNFEAFLANAFFTLGQVLFEIPTGMIADTFGRRRSYLLGCSTLAASTALYLIMWRIHGPFWGWALSSMLLGLGFTFFSGALEAWLVDALHATGYKGNLEQVFAKGQMVGGAAMLTGSVLGGVIAQYTSLGVPYILRSLVLVINFATAFFLMKDVGFTPKKSQHPLKEIRTLFSRSVHYGLGNPPVRWLMIAAPFTSGVGFYVFYALQPYLLDLYGNEKAYTIAGMIAALTAVAQIGGGFFAPFTKKIFSKRTTVLSVGTAVTSLVLAMVYVTNNFWIALSLIFLWGLLFAAVTPIRQAYINGNISSEQRATVLSFDSLMGSTGGIVIQPLLGRVADVYSYAFSFLTASLIQILAIPFILLARKQHAKADTFTDGSNDS